jgi:aspartate carbamoyltransferase catalytic subunit
MAARLYKAAPPFYKPSAYFPGFRVAPLRHLTAINDLTNDEVEQVFALAARYLKKYGDADLPHRIGKSTDLGKGRILATLFYEPSTRTRLSFESAMLRLGGKIMTSADPASSSAAKGESLADSVRMVSNYADAMVIRHKRDGAARLAAEYAQVPVINGGDGAHEHPTQTLGDLFTLTREGKTLKGLNVAIAGDLRSGRTVHSLVYALARFGSRIVPMPAPGMELPSHVRWRVRHEFSKDALFDRKHAGAVDALYVTRFQAERAGKRARKYPRIDLDFLSDKRYAHALVFHPLPRVDELDSAVDTDPRALYFRQAAYAVAVRMALLSLTLGLDGKFARYDDGIPKPEAPVYAEPHDIGIRCINDNCIVHEPADRKFTRNRFYVIAGKARRLRCYYCETDIVDFVAANRRTRRFADAADAQAASWDVKDVVFLATAREAKERGYENTALPARRKTG